MVKKILTKKRVFRVLAILGLFLVFLLFTILAFFYFYQGEEKVNLLFLGEAGEGHAGPSLTDTIIFTSMAPSGTVLLSIPRDIWFEPIQAKINTLYATGGFPKAKLVMQAMLGQKINGVILIDFSLFVKVVDQIGGIKVSVDGSFDDYQYPIPGKENDLCDGDKTFGCRYEHLHFEAGTQLMDGATALKFVRSRHAEGDEGTDYARSRRQQKVIDALKGKLISFDLLKHPKKLLGLRRLLKEGAKTDMTKHDLISMVKIVMEPSSRKMASYVLDGWEKAEGYLYHPKTHVSGQWVLLPQGNAWDGVHQFVESIL